MLADTKENHCRYYCILSQEQETRYVPVTTDQLYNYLGSPCAILCIGLCGSVSGAEWWFSEINSGSHFVFEMKNNTFIGAHKGDG